MPENYDSELARETYRTIEGDSTEKIPVTAEIVNGIVQGIIYGYQPLDENSIHLNVSREILSRESWRGRGGVKGAIQNIINLQSKGKKIEEKQAA